MDRLSEILTLEQGTVAFASDYMAAQARQGLRFAREAFDRDAGISGEESAWSAFLAEYGPEVGDRFPGADIHRLKLEFGEVLEDVDMTEVLKAGLRAWLRSGRAQVEYEAERAFWIQGGEQYSTSREPGSRASGGLTGSIPSRRDRSKSELKSLR